ncbi:gliding motility-associated ABC transporter substrate-binding protein GldG [uncultured Winogradskyella sp.]|uniref:gliding motility-associated ABC transporter substrate-binding protein GldG n=1 Tax=uncultured Winogradskyella sp. TaxID=395353 RepID=UPI003511A25A
MTPLKNKSILYIFGILIALILVNYLSSIFHSRWDLTKDKRYTLSDTSKALVADLEAPLIIDVFLEGDLPKEFKLLQAQTKDFIEEFQSVSNKISVNYIDPIEDEDTRERNINQLTGAGLKPYINTDNSDGKITQNLIFPWAFASYNDKTVKIPLLKRSITKPLAEQIDNSIEVLEYAFADGFNTLIKPKSKSIAVLRGNGQLQDVYLTDVLKTLRPYYNIAPFTLDSVDTNLEGTLKRLSAFDLIINAKPTEPFSEKEKLVLDQFTINGGKSLWLTEAVFMDKDSLYNDKGSTVATIKDLNLNDFFFKYGARINPALVKDLYSAPIMLAFGEGSSAQLQPVRWQYSPLAATNASHPITKNLGFVRCDFASPIDTLKNNISKTILLQSSEQSKIEGVPKTIALSSITEELDESSFNAGSQVLGVLLEGTFTSVYENRILPYKLPEFKTKGKSSKIVLISDGDVIKNDVLKNRPQELGFDPISGETFANKEFLLNAVNYMLDDSGLINIRGKEIDIAYLDPEKIKTKKVSWQLLNIVLPLVILTVFGMVFNYLRRRANT